MNDEARRTPRVRVWGTAAGRGTTAEAARGAMAWREYDKESTIPHADWLEIVVIERGIQSQHTGDGVLPG